jgi:hypothetical protein
VKNAFTPVNIGVYSAIVCKMARAGKHKNRPLKAKSPGSSPGNATKSLINQLDGNLRV